MTAESRTTNNTLPHQSIDMPYEFPADVTRDLPKAHGGAALQGQLKNLPEDFRVTEDLGYRASGQGEHAFLVIQKRELNTLDVVRRLAQFARIKPMSVGFAGLKDKQAISVQHFSVHLPGQPDPDWSQLNDAHCQILDTQRHHRKIRRGRLAGNQFTLTLRELHGDRVQAEKILAAIQNQGFPNYFGAQRFGWRASNLQRATNWVHGRTKKIKPEQKRMMLSAMRSHLFNQVLAGRVKTGTWHATLPGDVMLLDRTHKQFLASPPDGETIQRTQRLAIHPSGPLVGKSSHALQPTDQAAELERHILATQALQHWPTFIDQQGVKADRRALRVSVNDLTWEWRDQKTLTLNFSLPAGAYATMLIREMMVDENDDAT